MTDRRTKPEASWNAILTPQQEKVVHQKGTDRAFTGAWWNNHGKGRYACIACGQPLFSSDATVDSGTGWPSFDRPIDGKHLQRHDDRSFFLTRTEVVCKHGDA